MLPKANASCFRPFEALRSLLKRAENHLADATDKLLEPPRDIDESLSDEEAFRRAMKHVRPLGWSEPALARPRPVEIPSECRDASEVLERLHELVEGCGELDPFVTGEGIEGAATRRGRLHLGKLKKGEYSIQAHLDLHGLGPEQARERLETFLRQAQQHGHSCVRIVHGRGRHSSSEPAVLKRHLARWLSSRKMSRTVVAFASARWKDGGGGAVYVLLYRKRPPASKRPGRRG